MTGLEVLTMCERYAGDMRRLKLSYDMAMDAATRVTPRMDGNGGGRSSDVRSAPERFAVKAEGISRRMDARRAMYALELQEAANLLEQLPPDMASVLYRRMIDGRTVKEIAVELDLTVDSVRGKLARGRTALSGMASELDGDWDYREMETRFRQK
jgi:DNA-directed RNA polymerase specialized sigma24 family protein